MLIDGRTLIFLLVTLQGAQAWVVSHTPSASCRKTSLYRIALYSGKADDDDAKKISFDDAGQQLLDDENEERAALLANDEEDVEFEQKKGEYEAIREAIRARTADIGIEKSVVTAKIIEEANARAAAGQSVEGLDLSQITGSLQPPPSASDDEDAFELPSMFYKPEEQLTEEQKMEVDKVSTMGLFEQAKDELKYVEWPDLISTIKEVGLVLLLSGVTGWLLINWDLFLRDSYTGFGWIPRPEDIGTQFEGLELPDGWTDMMSEDDLADLPSQAVDIAAPASNKIGGL